MSFAPELQGPRNPWILILVFLRKRFQMRHRSSSFGEQDYINQEVKVHSEYEWVILSRSDSGFGFSLFYVPVLFGFNSSPFPKSHDWQM